MDKKTIANPCKEILLNPYKRILFSNKNEQTIEAHDMDESQNHYVEWTT